MKNDLVILVVDDDKLHYEVLSRVIRKSSLKIHSILHSVCYENSKILLEEMTPDIILLDYKLPDSIDLELISYLQKNSTMRFIPIVVMTSEGSELVAVRALQKGAMDYIVKSFSTSHYIERTIINSLEKMALKVQLEIKTKVIEARNAELKDAYNFKSKLMSKVNKELHDNFREILDLSQSILTLKAPEEKEAQFEILNNSNLCFLGFMNSVLAYEKIENSEGSVY